MLTAVPPWTRADILL